MAAVADPAADQAKPEAEADELQCCFVAHDEDEICRECGCTQNNACVRQGETCGWAEPGLCTACTPDAGDGWKHPEETDGGCPNPADYEIQDLEDSDPYQSITHACTEHVGDMLGHADNGNWKEGDPERWEVRAL